MDNNKEEWRPILGYEKFYEISSFGRIRNLKRYVKSRNGSRTVRERILRPSPDGHGYLIVTLCRDGSRWTAKIHKLVAEAFLGHSREQGFREVVDHIDMDKRNNDVKNLRLVSSRENSSYERGSSKYTGVSFNKQRDKYVSSITVNDRLIIMGFHEDEKVCAQWYQDALKSLEKDPTGKLVVVHKNKKSSKYRGVSLNKNRDIWESYVTVFKKRKHIGIYGCETAAYLAREKFIKENQQLFNN